MPDQKALDERSIRVFISSTFHDMQAERDELVKRVFPLLRRLCARRGVSWSEVDLRWGVTDEKSADGKVLPICLEEIRRCRPYFIGVLGERYGWVPDEIPANLVEREPWMEELRSRSVTELEILHGVLNDPGMAQHAYFYFRDPSYLKTLPPHVRSAFQEEPSAQETNELGPDKALARAALRAEKLAALKQRIRHSNLPLRENYPDPVAFGEMVLQDFTSLIDRLYPEGRQPEAHEREQMEQEAFALSRRGVYIARQRYFDLLDAHVRSRDLPLAVLGESGMGKSALLANWVEDYRQRNPGVYVLAHFIGSSSASTDWVAMLRRIMGELKRRFGIQDEIPDHPEGLRHDFASWLGRVAQLGTLVLVLDGLDQLEDRDGAPDLVWLPAVIPPNVRLILSTQTGRPLDELQKRGWLGLPLVPLELAERRLLMEAYLAQYGKELGPSRLERIAASPQTGNPLFLRLLLDELRLFGLYEKLDERITYTLEAAGLDELYAKVLARCEQDYERGRQGLVGEALSLLSSARRGLAETELLEILGSRADPLPTAFWSPLSLALETSLFSRSGLIVFAHEYLRRAVRDRYLSTPELERLAHLRLAGYFKDHESDQRRMEELPWQLARAGDWDQLSDLLAQLDFFQAAYNTDPFNLENYWTLVEANSPHRMLDAYRPVLDNPSGFAEYIWDLSLLLGDAGHRPEAFALRTYLVDYYRQKGDLDHLQRALGNLSNLLHDEGRLTEAMSLLQEHERISRSLGDMDGIATSLGKQANILFDRGELERAMQLHREEERICREQGFTDQLIRSLNGQGLVLEERGKLKEALAQYRECEHLARELGDRKSLSISLGNQANILKDTGDLEGAMKLHKQEEQLCRERGDQYGLSICLGNQGNVLSLQGDLEGALQLHQEQERMSREQGRPDVIALSLLNQGIVLANQGRQPEARRLADQALQVATFYGYASLIRAIKSARKRFWAMPMLNKISRWLNAKMKNQSS
jgi:tetratricopeptide (TPR) repeat protein